MTSPETRAEPPGRTADLSGSELAAQAVAQLLAPMARLMIGHGLQLPSMLELLKKALVDEAISSYGLAGKGSSDTRIALLTGVHRKDVKRLRTPAERTEQATPLVPIAASVVARWISEPRFLNSDQTARALARTPGRSQSGEPDFTMLVAEVSRDVGARAVLDELDRLGVVDVQDDGYMRLKGPAFVPREGLSESFHFLATNVVDHLATAVHNLAQDRSAPLMLEQSAFAAHLSPAQADELHARARQLWAVCLKEFLQTATVAEQRSLEDEGPRHRVRFGVYFHDAVEASEPDIAPRRQRARKHKGSTQS
jgi:hypothetical protein